jgi:hypothetical protein
MSASSTFLQLASAEYLQDHLPTLPSPACVAKFVFSLAVAPVVSTLRSLIITSAWDQVEIKLPRVRGRTPCRQLWWFNKIESRVSCYAKPAKNPTDKDPAGREKVCSPLAFSLYTSRLLAIVGKHLMGRHLYGQVPHGQARYEAEHEQETCAEGCGYTGAY